MGNLWRYIEVGGNAAKCIMGNLWRYIEVGGNAAKCIMGNLCSQTFVNM